MQASVRYIQHRPGVGDSKIIRPLFGSDGYMDRGEAYSIIDNARKGSVFFRFVISSDPATEDQKHDLNMRDVTTRTMQMLEEKLHKPLSWVASLHADHAPHRHAHVIAVVPTKLYAPDFERLRSEATEACLEQRQELDQRLNTQTKTREEAAWGRGY